MEPIRSRNKIVFIVLAAALLAAWGGGWWYCCRSDAIAFLPYHSGAKWIVDTRLPYNESLPAVPCGTLFKRTFFLKTLPDQATVSIRVFKSATAILNGQEIAGLKLDGQGWKQATTLSVAGMLHTGTNEISVTVTNISGPPALWLRLQAGTFSVGTDEQWLSSPTGGHWLNAHDASIPPVIPPYSDFQEKMNPAQAARRVWPELAFFAIAAAAIILLTSRLLKCWITSQPTLAMYVLLTLVIVGRIALWVHDVPRLASETGFDAQPHENYIRFIQVKGALPLPNDGWEMHQPPLYYLGAAVLMEVLGLTAGDDDAVIPLRAINGVIGLVQCWLALLCLQRIFPKNFSAQAFGLLVAGFLPVTIYTSFYVTNDPLAGLLATLALYLFLQLLESEKESPKLAIGVGLALGLAVLAKLTAALAVPVFLAVLGLRCLPEKASAPRWWRSMGIVLAVFILTCGWHYVRVWKQVGGLPLPNTQTRFEWWEDPGFRTGSYYFGFGHSLVSPLFSGWYSYADGMYSTLWGDGLISGGDTLLSRPPWNYDLAYLACLSALVLTLLAVWGLIINLRRFILTLEPVAGLLSGMIVVFAIGIALLTMSRPWLGSVRGLYALPSIVAFSILVAAGASWLSQRNRMAQMTLWFVALVWAGMVAGSFWIRTDHYEFWRRRALDEISRQDYASAMQDSNHALQLNPGDVASRVLLAEAFSGQGETPDAIREYDQMLGSDPDNLSALKGLADLLATSKGTDRQRAVQLGTHACELTYWRQTYPIAILARAQIQDGRMHDSIGSLELACDLAVNTGKTNELEILAAELNNTAWRLATSPDAAQRDGQSAVRLAQRACDLTQWHKTICVGTLAAAYAEAGQFDLAVATAERACELATENGENDLLASNQQLLKLYRAHQPVRDKSP